MPDYALMMRAADWTQEQRTVYTEIAQRFLARNPRGRRMLAVDGRNGVGKSRLAEELRVAFARAEVTSFAASMGDFLNVRRVRERQGPASARGYYDDTYNLSELKRALLEPFMMGGSTSFVLKSYDAETESYVEPDWESSGQNAVLIVEGEFLARPALRDLWHGFLLVEAADDVRGPRLQARDGAHPLISHSSHGLAQQAHAYYEEAAAPFDRADMLLDNSDWQRPILVR
ncbi:MAG TPA: hypothetical protein H9830_12670 [Candidatus Agrococcus pullicola]|uniref:Uridine kinase n=1 Tax=Candidatus Agrococcus pullicola TaxID=2838429 RepID=A0A9D2CB50_9MICO|nr:hypothetical protein [Candidatus Agrococcus pullicola]